MDFSNQPPPLFKLNPKSLGVFKSQEFLLYPSGANKLIEPINGQDKERFILSTTLALRVDKTSQMPGQRYLSNTNTRLLRSSSSSSG